MAHLRKETISICLRSVSLAGIILLYSSLLHAQVPDNENNNRLYEVGTGSYPSTMEEVSSFPDHVIYRPENLAALNDQKLGVVVWGNGGCSPDGASSRFHLAELASHGFLVIANGRILSGPSASIQEETEIALGFGGTSAEQLIEAIDWALQENDRPDSPYYGLIDGEQIAVSGFSCGGVQAIDVAIDPRIDTLVLMNSGLFDADAAPAMPGMDVPKADLNEIHTSVIYIQGGETDIAFNNGLDDYERINQVPIALASLQGAGHGGTYNDKNGGRAAQVAVSWLKWQLRDDQDAAQQFVGSDCGLCQDEEWIYMSKRLD